MAYTEFYCQSGGSNLNAGSTNANAATLTYASGNWVQATRVFTVAIGNPATDGVAVGDFVSVYADGSSETGYVARVTARDATTITLSSSIKAGAAPTDGTGNRTLKVGGAWAGPNGTSGFPFSLNTSIDALTNTSGNIPRVNMKNDATYSITAGITGQTRQNSGWVMEGYTTSVGDGGRFVIDGGTSGASYVLLTMGTVMSQVRNGIFAHNGATGSANALVTISDAQLYGVVVHDVLGSGVVTNGSGIQIVECEAYACNSSNTANKGGFEVTNTGDGRFVRCVSHDNSGSNNIGFAGGSGGNQVYEDCIADTNGNIGFQLPTSTNQIVTLSGCDCYNNGSHGISGTGSGPSSVYIENCNLIKNGGYGISISSGGYNGRIVNCGFGSGTQANTSGQTNVSTSGNLEVSGSVSYAAGVTPWTDPANGDFRINLAAAKGAGRGTFTETAASYAGTVGYPDIGAAQHQDAGGGTSGPFNHMYTNGGVNG